MMIRELKLLELLARIAVCDGNLISSRVDRSTLCRDLAFREVMYLDEVIGPVFTPLPSKPERHPTGMRAFFHGSDPPRTVSSTPRWDSADKCTAARSKGAFRLLDKATDRKPGSSRV